MVKNTAGGNKTKRGARKDATVSGNKEVRLVDENEPDEMYAVVNKYFGNKMCEVICHDGVTRLCVIRAKFSGKGKSENRIEVGRFIMVGVRDWEVRSHGGEKKCDLLEVYNDGDKEKLLHRVDPNIANLKKVIKTTSGNSELEKIINEDVDFSTSTFEYNEMTAKSNTDENNVVLVHNSKIDFDDI